MLTREDLNKLENHNPPNNRRRDEIINFLRNHPDCTKEDVVRGVKNYIIQKNCTNFIK
jgi:hypothetical protein